MKKLSLLATLLAAALAASLAGGALGGSAEETPGLTDTTILLGGTTPLSGAASAYASVARGAEAYLKYVNSKGGVNGRTIEYKYLDDAYNPAQTVQATRQLVEQDKVFAVFNSLGTEHNQAIRDYLNQMKVPQLFAASGAATWGRDFKQYPYTIGYQPSYIAEGTILGKYVAKTAPTAKIAILVQNDDYGRDLIRGLEKGLGKKASQIVAKKTYEPTDPDVQSQMAELKASGADTLAIFATPKYAIQAYVFASKLGWKPKLVINNAVSAASNIMTLATLGAGKAATTGTISLNFLKDPNDPRWTNDSAMKLYRELMAKYNPRGDVKDVYNVYGMAVAYTLVDALTKAGRNLTRDGIMDAVARLNEPSNPFLLPGVVVTTTPLDHFPLKQGQLQRWNGTGWVPFGGVINARG